MSELCVFITAQSQLEVDTFMSAIASRLSFLDVFYASLSGPEIKPQGCRPQQRIGPFWPVASCILLDWLLQGHLQAA